MTEEEAEKLEAKRIEEGAACGCSTDPCRCPVHWDIWWI